MAADAFYGHPSGKLKLVGITGTNGKTTTVTLLYHMFRHLGYECGLLSPSEDSVLRCPLFCLQPSQQPFR